MNITLWKIKNFPHIARGYMRILKDKLSGVSHPQARLYAEVYKNGDLAADLGCISINVVTDAFASYLVQCLIGAQSAGVFKYHGCGTGTGAESAGNTALSAEVGSRVIGTQEVGANSKQYKSVAQIAFSSNYAITEHGVFSASSGGTLFDRSVFAAINVDSSTEIKFTFTEDVPSGN